MIEPDKGRSALGSLALGLRHEVGNHGLRPVQSLARAFSSPAAKRLWTLVHVAFLALAYAALLLVCLLVFVPRLTGIQVRNVISGSMEPHIHIHAVAVAEPVRAADVRVGDVILFRPPDRIQNGISYGPLLPEPVLHRVVRIVVINGQPAFETKGDANSEGDGWVVPADHVLGKLVFDVPALGNVLGVMTTRAGYFAFVVVPGLLIMIPELLLIFRWIRWGESLQRPALEAPPE